MAKPPRLPTTPQQDPENSSGPDYDVGYRRPPQHSRWKPGQCGYPSGRPKQQRNLRTVVRDTLNQRVKVREGDRIRSLSKLDSFVLNVVNKSIQGDPKAQHNLLNLLRSVGMAAEPVELSNHEPLTPHDAEIVADFLRRHTPTAGASAKFDNQTDHQGKGPCPPRRRRNHERSRAT